MLRGTVNSGARECRTRLHIDSPEPQDVIERIVRLAKQGCFAEQMAQTAVPLASSYVLNGVEREISLPAGRRPVLSGAPAARLRRPGGCGSQRRCGGSPGSRRTRC